LSVCYTRIITPIDHLNEEEGNHVNEIINNHKDLFRLPEESLGHTDITAHKIATTYNRSINTKQYMDWFPPVHKDEINKEVKDLLENDLLSNHRIQITRSYGSYLKNLIQRIIKGGEW